MSWNLKGSDLQGIRELIELFVETPKEVTTVSHNIQYLL